MRVLSFLAAHSLPLRTLPVATVFVLTFASPVRVSTLVAQASTHAAHAPSASPASDQRLGKIYFPTSATPAAHASFERGVLYLHNFHYPQAVAAFRRARALDSTDVMSAAFEAFAWTYPVWNTQDSA
ncbi:MAG: hypothetical protein ABI877_15740, partial [Gemmatimonadaceae bacterium]